MKCRLFGFGRVARSKLGRIFMRRIGLLLFLQFVIVSAAHGQANTISTFAGGGTNGSTPTTAHLPQVYKAVRDTSGNTYISVPSLSIVYKVNGSGTMTVYAGTGILGFSNDGKAATTAQLDYPTGLALDSSGNLYIADSSNNRIRKVTASTGIITTVAGSGSEYNGAGFFGGYSGDGGAATDALLNGPSDVAVDNSGNLYIADVGNEVIRLVNGGTGTITTYAGNGNGGYSGDNGPATSAMLLTPIGVTVDSSANLFIADKNNCIVRRVDATTKIITTYVGTPDVCGYSGDSGAATSAKLNLPVGVYADATGFLFIADFGNNRIRKIDNTAHDITTAAGTGVACTTPTGCGDGGAATSALLNAPKGIFEDSSGILLVADTGDMRARTVTSGTIANYAGSGNGGDGGPATSSMLSLPYEDRIDSKGNLFIMDSFGARIQRVDATTQNVTTFAGNGVLAVAGASNGDGGLATAASLNYPVDIALDSAGNMYILDRRTFNLRKVTLSTGVITTIAGNGQQCSAAGNPNQFPACGDGGAATSASFCVAAGVAVDASNNIYISDECLSRIRVINAETGVITNYAGNLDNNSGYSGDGGAPTSALLNSPIGMAFSPAGDLYIADANNNVIRVIYTEENIIETYAFNGEPTFGGDGGSASQASMFAPEAVAFDAAGNLFVGGGYDNIVRRIDVNDSSVATVAGNVDNLDGGYNGDGEPSTQALLSNLGLAVDANENLLIADAGNERIRKVHMVPVASWTPATLMTFPTLLPGQFSDYQDITFSNNGLNDLTVSAVVQGASADFTVSNFCTSSTSASPQGSCDLLVYFSPPVGAAAGPVSGTLVVTTNDPNNPTVSFALSGTIASTGFALSVLVVSPAGNVASVTSDPTGINSCGQTGGTCSASFASGTTVTLVAAVNSLDPGYSFLGWSGNCTPVANIPFECTTTMSQAQTVTATFGASTISVASFGNGTGTITSSPSGINCGTTCTFTFPAGTQTVTLTATPNTGSVFVGWEDFYCTNATANTCTISLTNYYFNEVATAIFSVARVPFTKGDVFLGSTGGLIFEYHPSGTLVQVLPPLNSNYYGGFVYGMTFDSNGTLYAADPYYDFQNPTAGVETFASNGTGPTAFGGLSTATAGSVRVDPTGNVFVGLEVNSATGNLLEYAPGNTTVPSASYFPAYYKTNGIFAFEIGQDDVTMFYDLGTPSLYSFNTALGLQNPDLTDSLPGNYSGDIRQLPDGTILVADGDRVVRLNSTTGAVVQTYQPATFSLALGLALDGDGVDFWTDDSSTGVVYKINITSGAIVTQFNTQLGQSTFDGLIGLGGMAEYGAPASGGEDLSVAFAGTGTGSVSSSPAGITCPSACSANYALGQQVTLTEMPAVGSTFVGWSGNCTGTATTCVVTMSAAEAVTATFNTGAPVTISVVIINNGSSGVGTVTDNTGVIDCTTATGQGQTGTCSTSYAAGSTVTYTETPGAGSVFTGWTSTANPCQTGTAPNICTITASNFGSVLGNFGNGTGTFTLTVALPSNLTNSTGSGSVGVGVTGGGISCNFSGATTPTGTCSNSTEKSGEIVELIPIPNDNSTFGGYSGTCSNQVGNNCFVTMSQNQTVTPVFTIIQVPVTETITGNGSIVDTANAGKINCSSTNGVVTGTCSANYPSGTSITLTETTGTGYTFTAFGGTFCQTSTPTTCTFTANTGNNYNETATFTINTYLLNASTEGGSGTGTVTSNANNLGGVLDCGPNNQPPSGCGIFENYNWPVTLTATPSSGSTFAGWSASGVSGFTLPCTTASTCSFNMPVTLSAGLTVTATFNSTSSFALNVTDAGTGSGTVSSSPSGILCPSTCTANFTSGSKVTLTETPNSGSTFAGWSGGGCSGTGSCVVTMSTVENVTATFNSTTSFALTVTEAGSGGGTVSSSPSGILCPSTCMANFASGSQVTLTATQNSGSTFAGWSGAGCSGTGQCVVTMSAAQSVTATFNVTNPTLTIMLAGTGTGSVTFTSSSTFTCSDTTGVVTGTCSASFPNGAVVNVSEIPGTGSTFAGWSGGGCSGTGATCNVTLTANTTVTATFNKPTFAVTVSESGTGTGTVTSSPSGITCPSTCTANFTSGTSLTLTPVPAAGSTFAGWTDSTCVESGTGACVFSVTGAVTVQPVFNKGNYTLTVSLAGTGAGNVTSNPEGINCGSGCSSSFTGGTVVTLTATPASGSVFAGWGGACSGTGSCVITMNAAAAVTATFNLPPPSFTLTVTDSDSGTGSGTVTSSPAGIDCPEECAASYVSGTVVTLTATPASGSAFAGWSGAGCSGTGTCVVTMNAAESVTATFNVSTFTFTTGPGYSTTVSTTPGGNIVVGFTLSSTTPTTVGLGCTSSAPQYLTCLITPAEVSLNGTGPSQVAIVLTSYCQGDVPGVPVGGPGAGMPGGVVGVMLLGLALCGTALCYRGRRRVALSFAIMLLAAVGGAACGNLPQGTAGRTPPGLYTLTITATVAGQAPEQVQIQVNVQ
jgi:Divergent InlB B-repeat domain/NHL repeat